MQNSGAIRLEVFREQREIPYQLTMKWEFWDSQPNASSPMGKVVLICQLQKLRMKGMRFLSEIWQYSVITKEQGSND